MDGAETSEGFSEWEQIQFPTDSTTPSRTDMNPIKDNDLQHQQVQQDLSVFPPSQHEGLELTSKGRKEEEEEEQQQQQQQVHIQEEEVSSSVQDSWSCTGDGASPRPLKKASEIGKILTSGIIRVAARVRNYVAFGCGFWSIGAVSGALTAVLLSLAYVKVRRWRTSARIREEKKDPLILLIQEKDQVFA